MTWQAYAGQYEEAIRRRKEAELSRAQLQQKIESLKQARNSGHRTGVTLTTICSLLPIGGVCAYRSGTLASWKRMQAGPPFRLLFQGSSPAAYESQTPFLAHSRQPAMWKLKS